MLCHSAFLKSIPFKYWGGINDGDGQCSLPSPVVRTHREDSYPSCALLVKPIGGICFTYKEKNMEVEGGKIDHGTLFFIQEKHRDSATVMHIFTPSRRLFSKLSKIDHWKGENENCRMQTLATKSFTFPMGRVVQ